MIGSDDGAVCFGPFKLFPSSRTLERDGVVLALGDRALDILIVLVERAGEIVSHRDLIARVWRDLIVSPGNLRVHMTTLRKALGDGEDGARYIANVAGQGYTFVAPVKRTGRSTSTASVSPPQSAVVLEPRVLPPALARMVGRDNAVRAIVADLRTDRFVTIVGAGGMGKTTVAISVAHAMLEEFAGKVCFVDLGALADPKLLTATIASTLGLSIQSADPLATLMTFLRTTRMLLLLDNCEHVIDAVAPLAEMIFNQAPQAHILATSREALRVEGEHAHWLRPLESPPPDAKVSAATALTFPAVKLFVERAMASDSRFQLTDMNAPIVADICGRLDGIALALEFVAGRIGTHGLEGTATLLGKRLGLHWQGRRTALPRHQTLHALLDWSYGLLPPAEQHVLRRLSVFVGTFTLEAAQAVASDAELDEAQLAHILDQLIAKSLVSAINLTAGASSYRLLETTRIYAIRKLEECGDEMDATAERHARYFTQLLRPDSGSDRWARHEHLGNLRAALEWCFGERAESNESRRTALGIDLAAACVSAFLDLSLWNECRKWSEAALAVLPAATRGDRRELVLQEALAISSLLTNAIEARTAIDRGLEIARRLGETAIRFRLLGALHVYVLRMTDFKSSLTVAEEMDAVARETNDVSRRAIADWMMGSSQFVLGNPAVSKQLFESGFAHGIRATDADQQLAGLYYRTRALYGLARVQWLCGFPDRALHSARQSMIEAAETGSPVNVSYSLVYSCYVFLWCGDLETAQEMNETVMAQPHWQGRLMWFHAEALALKGELLVRRGDLEAGIELLRETLASMQATSQKNLMLSVTACCLAEALAATGRAEEALKVINDALALAPGGAETWDAPELLRIKAVVLLSMPRPDQTRAENCLMQSLALARHQGAIGWELRSTITMARLRATQGRTLEAREMLSKIYAQFTEGFETQDLKAAAALLAELDASAILTSPSLSSAGGPGSYRQ
jgi:predicted ATPase/DNA-binding winged helix-turn-helix (wHTH) protein